MAFARTNSPLIKKPVIEEQKNIKNLAVLSNDCVRNIMTFFSGREQAKASSVSKEWNRAATLPSSWSLRLKNEYCLSSDKQSNFAKHAQIKNDPKIIFQKLSTMKGSDDLKKLIVSGNIDLINCFIQKNAPALFVLSWSLNGLIPCEEYLILENLMGPILYPSYFRPKLNFEYGFEEIESIWANKMENNNHHPTAHALVQMIYLAMAIVANNKKFIQWMLLEKQIQVTNPEFVLSLAENLVMERFNCAARREKPDLDMHLNPELKNWIKELLNKINQDKKSNETTPKLGAN